MLSKLYLVRHAEPLLNTNLNYKIPPGPALSDVGRQQAREAADFLENVGIEAVYASPLARASQTADAIAAKINLQKIVTPAIQEMQDGESLAEVRSRCWQFIQSLQNVNCAAVVSHGSPVRALLLALSADTLDFAPYETHHGNPTSPAGIWRAVKIENHWQLDYIFTPTYVPWDAHKVDETRKRVLQKRDQLRIPFA